MLDGDLNSMPHTNGHTPKEWSPEWVPKATNLGFLTLDRITCILKVEGSLGTLDPFLTTMYTLIYHLYRTQVVGCYIQGWNRYQHVPTNQPSSRQLHRGPLRHRTPEVNKCLAWGSCSIHLVKWRLNHWENALGFLVGWLVGCGGLLLVGTGSWLVPCGKSFWS